MSNEEKIIGMLTTMQADMAAMQADMSAMQATLAQHGERLDTMQATLAQHGERLDTMQATLVQHGEMLKELDARSLKSAVLLETDVARDIHALQEGYSELNRKIDTLATKEQVKELANDVETIKYAVTLHSADIKELKQAR